MKFHFEFPRLFNRVPFVAGMHYVADDGIKTQEFTVGYGKYAVMLTTGRWFFQLGVL